jgi:phosphoribosyl 1,2-cyclic phosphodiesterase
MSPVRFCYLGSGSKGNAALVEAGGTRVMVDCGFSSAEVERRLARAGREPGDLDALLVTHEHGDHIGGVARFARRHSIPVWMTAGTFAGAPDRDLPELRLFNCHETFCLGDLQITPVPVPHDAREPCQFVFGDGGFRLGILTDTGHVTPHIIASLRDCDALMVECNHDPQMLACGPYPTALKARVGGRLGHLNNEQAAGLVERLETGRLQHLVAVHISEVNNTAALARRALARAVGARDDEIETVCQQAGIGWRELR